jgi:NAD+ synthase
MDHIDKELAGRLVAWIRETVISAGCKGATFGMSGGIDSSVIAALCRRAFPDNCLGLIMPCHSDGQDREHAELLAHQFGIPFEVAVLDEVYNSLLKVIVQGKVNTDADRLARGNIKSRLRMLTLYYYANLNNYMVVGSGNRCEWMIGYFTKYGDSGVDMLPLINLVKGQVRRLGQELGVPEAIIDKAPSAGLWPGQTDEAEMGITYADLDQFLLKGSIANGETVKRIVSLVNGSNHKRNLPHTMPRD